MCPSALATRLHVLISATEPMQEKFDLGLDLLTSGAVHTEVLPCITGIPSLVLMVAAIFHLKHRQTDRQTNKEMHLNAILVPHAGNYTAGVGKINKAVG